MKKFKFKINGNDYEVNIKSVESNLAEVEVNGTSYEVELEQKMAQPITPRLVRERAIPLMICVTKSITKTSKPQPKRWRDQKSVTRNRALGLCKSWR